MAGHATPTPTVGGGCVNKPDDNGNTKAINSGQVNVYYRTSQQPLPCNPFTKSTILHPIRSFGYGVVCISITPGSMYATPRLLAIRFLSLAVASV